MIKKIYAYAHYTANNDLSKAWFIKIKIPDYIKGDFKWKKCYGDINKFDTLEGRLSEMARLRNVLETTGEYKTTQGSRHAGVQVHIGKETDLVHLLTQCLENSKGSLRLATARKYAGFIKNLTSWLESIDRVHMPVGALTPAEADSFLSYVIGILKLSASTHNGILSIFRSWFKVLIRQGIVSSNPWEGIAGLPEHPTASLFYQPGQVEILKDTIAEQDPQLWQFIQFIFYTFIRPGELRQLKISDIFFESQQILIRSDISKNKKTQYVQIPLVFLKELYRLKLHTYPAEYYIFSKDGKPGETMLGINSMKDRHLEILKTLKFNTNRHKMYSWKHTGAVTFVKNNGNLKDLQTQLRHHSLDQVNDYLKDMGVYQSEFIKNLPSI